jgi:hypothetical protein
VDQGGRLDVKSIMAYAHDVVDVRLQTVMDMPAPIDTGKAVTRS